MHIRDTRIETIQFVMPEHTNPLGNLFGGRMMHWMTTAGTLAASRISRGPVVLGSMDHISFLSPVRVSEVVTLAASVEWIGTSSMEVTIEVESENPATGERRLTTRAHMAYISIDAEGKSRPFPVVIHPDGPEEDQRSRAALQRKKARLARMAERRIRLQQNDLPEGSEVSFGLESHRIVFPEDCLQSNLMFAGQLMAQIDEVGGALALRYARSPVVTAAIDAMDFFYPIHAGNLLILRSGLNHVGRTSMEIGIRVEAEEPLTGQSHHTCSAYLTFVALDGDGNPQPVPAFRASSDAEKLRSLGAEKRRIQRLEHRKNQLA